MLQSILDNKIKEVAKSDSEVQQQRFLASSSTNTSNNKNQLIRLQDRLGNLDSLAKKVREKSRECHNHKLQPFPDPKRKRKPTNLNKHKPNKCLTDLNRGNRTGLKTQPQSFTSSTKNDFSKRSSNTKQFPYII